jgi:hypothetical protein
MPSGVLKQKIRDDRTGSQQVGLLFLHPKASLASEEWNIYPMIATIVITATTACGDFTRIIDFKLRHPKIEFIARLVVDSKRGS